MRGERKILVLMSGIAAVAGSQAVHATPILPSATYIADVTVYGSCNSSNGVTVNQSGAAPPVPVSVSCAGNSAQISFSDNSIQVSGNDTGSFGDEAFAQGRLVYYLEVNGPELSVPLTISSAIGGVTMMANGIPVTMSGPEASSSMSISIPGQETIAFGCAVSVGEFTNCTPDLPNFDISGNYNVPTGQVIRVLLSAGLVVYNNGTNPLTGEPMSATAFADPIFSIDPNLVSDAAAYSITYSPNFTPLASVPEPASIALFGGPALFWLARRRRGMRKNATRTLAAANATIAD